MNLSWDEATYECRPAHGNAKQWLATLGMLKFTCFGKLNNGMAESTYDVSCKAKVVNAGNGGVLFLINLLICVIAACAC